MNLQPIQPAATPDAKGRFTWRGLLVIAAAAVLIGLAGAWIGESGPSHFAPILLFPILLGMFVGFSMIGVVRFAQIGHRPTALFGVLLAAFLTSIGQHYIAYVHRYYARPIAGSVELSKDDLSPLLSEMVPSFPQFMAAQARLGRPLARGYAARGWAAWLSWSIDGLLLIGAATAVMASSFRVPYCDRCGSWYRAVRSGKLDVPTAMRLGDVIGVEGMDSPRSPRYRLSACQSGCGPTRCELSWEESRGSIAIVQVWLDAIGRSRIVAILDRVDSEPDNAENGKDSES